jgi:hypothetical protein
VWADRQRPELVEGETPVRKLRCHFFDPVELGFLVRISRFFPGTGALERDAVLAQQLP